MTRCAPMLPSPVVASLPIGNVGNDAAKVVDGDGLALMPGIIDIHTHYDAQVTWDPTVSPSPSLGVTTIVTSNCGFGIVPSPPDLRDPIIRISQ
jgi:N-acyl-D-amino-acid deacylase